MAITRTNMTDDDGSGTTGTILNNAWKQELYGQIDGALARVCYGPAAATTLSDPAYNNYRPSGGELRAVWTFNPTVSTAITGFVAEPDGTAHLLINTGSFPILLANAHANSAAANRLIGPGYANYSLLTWGSIWMVYSVPFTAWILQKA
jgi:hypothetical protein